MPRRAFCMDKSRRKEGILLVVDDNRQILTALRILLERYFERVILLAGPSGIDAALRDNAVDVVLLDMNFASSVNNGNEGIYWLGRIKEQCPEVQVVLFTAYGGIDLAVEGIKRGASDFVVKPWDNDKLVASLQAAYNLRKSRGEIKRLREANRALTRGHEMFWGHSPAMERLRETVSKVAATDANVLISGENGTGKEMLAREIHRLSARRDEPLVAVDMGAVAETLFESELFGHVKGAFTDAKADRAGKFEAAHRGTLFLDEIGNLPLHLQAKLLTAIQSGAVTRVGANTPRPVDIRLVCASNRDLERMVGLGDFREDLLYRINTIHLELPPLRERREDIMPMAELFLREYAAKYRKAIDGFDARARRGLLDHPWNGNVRELRHTVEKAVILCDGGSVDAASLMLRPSQRRGAAAGSATTLEEMERVMIREAIARHDGNLTAVAEQLGISRQTLYNKIKRYQIS